MVFPGVVFPADILQGTETFFERAGLPVYKIFRLLAHPKFMYDFRDAHSKKTIQHEEHEGKRLRRPFRS